MKILDLFLNVKKRSFKNMSIKAFTKICNENNLTVIPTVRLSKLEAIFVQIDLIKKNL